MNPSRWLLESWWRSLCSWSLYVVEELVMADSEAPVGHWEHYLKAFLMTAFEVSHALNCPCYRFMTDAARREQESLKKKIQPKLSLTLSSTVSRGNVSTPPRHSSGSLTPPVTPPITPSSSFRSSTPTGKCIPFCLFPNQLAFFLCGFWEYLFREQVSAEHFYLISVGGINVSVYSV